VAVTVKQLITNALRKLGIVDPSPQEHADGLSALRMMLEGWSLESLMIPFKPTETFLLDRSKALYRMGIDGDWDTVRPETIEYIRIQREDGTTVPVRASSPNILQWQSTVPTEDPSLFLFQSDGIYGYIEFNAYPVSPRVLVTSLKPFDAAALENFDTAFDADAAPQSMHPSGFSLTGIQTPLEFPTGYEQCITYNLAVHLRPEYPGLTLPEEVVAMARASKTLIKRRNTRPTQMVLEGALRGGSGHYDIRLGPVR
jgi:hypothetical protein